MVAAPDLELARLTGSGHQAGKLARDCEEQGLRIIFSRKGFDTGSGGAPSPIIDGRPVSLPIPTKRRSMISYEDLGLGDDHLCHEYPMFIGDRCAFGQCSTAFRHKT